MLVWCLRAWTDHFRSKESSGCLNAIPSNASKAFWMVVKSLDVRMLGVDFQMPRPVMHRLSLDVQMLGKPFECLCLFCINWFIFIGIRKVYRMCFYFSQVWSLTMNSQIRTLELSPGGIVREWEDFGSSREFVLVWFVYTRIIGPSTDIFVPYM